MCEPFKSRVLGRLPPVAFQTSQMQVPLDFKDRGMVAYFPMLHPRLETPV